MLIMWPALAGWREYDEPLKGHENGYSWRLEWLWGWYSVYYPYWFEGRPGQA